MTTADIRWTEPKLLGLIEARFCAPEWATFPQVANGTGWRQRRWLDAVSMNLYPSRGLELHGFEVKVSRGDWKRELADPQKIEDMAGNLDRLWIVAPAGLIDADDLPAGWGLLVTHKSRKQSAEYELFAKRKAGLLHGEQETGSMARTFVAALLRRAEESMQHRLRSYIPVDQIEDRLKRRYERGVADGEMESRSAISKAQKMVEFERALGMRVTEFGNPEEYGREFKAFLEMSRSEGQIRQSIEFTARKFRNHAETLEGMLSQGDER